MALATNWSTSNTAGIDLFDVWSATANAAGSLGENVAPYPPFNAGTTVIGLNGAKYVYVKLGTGGCTGQGYLLVAPLNAYDAAVMMSNSVGNFGDPVGVPVSTTAGLIGDYLWMQTSGLCSTGVRVAALAVKNVPLASTTSATPGVVDDAVANPTKNIPGMVITTTVVGAGLSPAELNNPTVGTTN